MITLNTLLLEMDLKNIIHEIDLLNEQLSSVEGKGITIKGCTNLTYNFIIPALKMSKGTRKKNLEGIIHKNTKISELYTNMSNTCGKELRRIVNEIDNVDDINLYIKTLNGSVDNVEVAEELPSCPIDLSKKVMSFIALNLTKIQNFIFKKEYNKYNDIDQIVKRIPSYITQLNGLSASINESTKDLSGCSGDFKAKLFAIMRNIKMDLLKIPAHLLKISSLTPGINAEFKLQTKDDAQAIARVTSAL